MSFLRRIIMFKKLIACLMASAFLISTLTGCNTVSGAGKDIEKGGEKIKQEADEHR